MDGLFSPYLEAITVAAIGLEEKHQYPESEKCDYH
jgi:hypothetical protein